MRKHVLIVLALGALIAVSAVGIATAAGGETPVTVKVGNLELTANGGFSPTALSKTKQTPIALKASGEVKEADGTHPPAIRDTAAAEKACKSSIIGTGEATAQVAFAEQNPINVNSKILVFSGGESGGKATMFVHAYFSQPISGAIVTTVTIKKHKNGRFGTQAIAKIPQITGGSGSITKFNLEIKKNVGGINPISAKCTDGKLKVHVEGKFEDGTKAQTEIIRSCTPKG